MRRSVLVVGLFVSLGSVAAQADESKGVGPIAEIKLEKVDPKMAKAGEKIFTAKCSACHKLEERYVGPALGGVTKRRTPEWIMNMILNPGQMTQEDETAKGLLAEYLTQMTFQNVSKDEARSILEYFRASDEKPAAKNQKKGS